MTSQQIVGQPIDSVLQIIGLSQQCRDAIAARMPFRNLECVCSIPGKRELTVNLTLSRIRVAAEEAEEDLLVIEDITGRKRSEETLKLFRTLIDRSMDAIEVVDPETGRFLDVNETSCLDLGYTREELLSSTVFDIDPTVERSSFQTIVAEVRKSGSFTWQGRHRRKDGATFPVEVNMQYAQLHRDYIVTVARDITERERAEEEIRQSHRKYEELVNSIDGIVWEGDARTFRFSFVSKQAERILGYPAEHWISGPTFWKDHIHPEDREWAVSFCINATAEKQSHQLEYRMIAADGRVVWLHDIVTVVLKDEQPEMLRGIMVDITERKQAEQEREVLHAIGETVNTAANLDELLQSIHRNIKKLMFAENCYIALYDARTEMLTFPLFVDQFDPMPSPRTKRNGLTEYVLRTEKPLLLTPELLDELVRDNEVEIIGTPPESWLGVPLLTESQPIGVLVVQSYEPGQHYTDIEKDLLVAIGNQTAVVISRRRTEEALQRSLSLLTATLESTADAILVVDTEGKIVSFNQKFLDFWRFPASIIGSQDRNQALVFVLDQLKDPDAFLKRTRELYAQPEAKSNDSPDFWRMPGSIIGSQDHNQALALVLDQLKDPDAFLKRTRELYAQPEAESIDILEFKDGRVFERYSHPQRLAGITVGRVWSYRDITERRNLEAQLIQAQKMESIGALAGGIAHDFNNILGIILGHTSLIERTKRGDAEIEASIDAISQAVHRGTGLVRQLLTFARKTDTEIQSVGINLIIQELVKMLSEMFPKTITFAMELEDSVPIIKADPNQLHQALLNLAVNARDAMPNGGTLTFKTLIKHGENLRQRFSDAQNERYVCVTVTDTGTGMDEETQRRIFDPFFTTKELGKGTGLGMSVVYGVMTAHQGFIDMESSLGAGTTFFLYFPVQKEEAVLPQIDGAKPSEVPGGAETLLVVEDEEMLRELVKAVLEGKGYNVLTASDGAEAISLYEAQKDEIALVLTDMGLPRVDGAGVLAALKGIDPNVKVIVASGYLEPEKRAKIMRAGVKDIVQKPYASDEVLRKIRDTIDGRS
ncbi:MAG: PAS domain S-box protein [Bacteroidetes bacterium]|nr:PAS domain S-box protein [Bacteroidota bacterium]